MEPKEMVRRMLAEAGYDVRYEAFDAIWDAAQATKDGYWTKEHIRRVVFDHIGCLRIRSLRGVLG